MSRDYKVGKGKPPVASRFEKGKSGNPSGRPKKATETGAAGSGARTSVDVCIQDIAIGPTKIMRDGKAEVATIAKAIQLRRMQLALGGNRLAAKEVTSELRALDQIAIHEAAERYVFWRNYVRIQKNVPLNLPMEPDRPLVLPHPLDIIVDPVLLTVEFVGPMEQEDLPLFMIALHLRRAAFACAELHLRYFGRDDLTAATLVDAAIQFDSNICPSLGGTQRNESQPQRRHRLTSLILETRWRTHAQLLDEANQALGAAEKCARAAGILLPDEPMCYALSRPDHAGNGIFKPRAASVKPRCTLARNPDAVRRVHRMMLDGRTMPSIATALEADAVSRSAVARYVRLYRTQYERVADFESLNAGRGSVPFSIHASLSRWKDIVGRAQKAINMRDVDAKQAMIRDAPASHITPASPAGASEAQLHVIRTRILGLDKVRQPA